MIKQSKKLLALAAFASLGLSASSALAYDDIIVDGTGEIPYVIDARNVVARSDFGLCWRTGYWTPAAAESVLAGQFPVGCACDKDIIAADKCTVAEPTPAPQVINEKIKLDADALFDFDKSTLRPEGRASLDELATKVQRINLEVILAVGHTDRMGSDSYNRALSMRRAEAVKAYLVGRGIDANRIYTDGKGESQPVTGNQCDGIKQRRALIECLQPDRRVEIEVIGTAPEGVTLEQ